MKFQIASISFIAWAALAVGRTVTGRVDNTTSPNLPEPGLLLPPALGGLDFDPTKYADDVTWAKYVTKGDHLMCLMQATDKGAGFLAEDTRTLPSVASRFHGELRGRCLLL